MTDIGQIERKSQDRIVKFFQEELNYDYLGNWEHKENNSNLLEDYLLNHLRNQGYSDELSKKAIEKLRIAAQSETAELYDINKDIYEILRYGKSVKVAKGENERTVQFIDWDNPSKNHFAVAEEVAIEGQNDKRPDIVIYVNGIAVAIIELKRSTNSVNKAIRQNIDNQKIEFIQWFFNTTQLLMGGSDTAGLRYGTIETPEKYYQRWKEPSEREWDTTLDKHIYQFCRKERLLEIIHDFIIFDGGMKKVCRPHQYFGVKAAQENVLNKEDGIIWHTQGSGKSLTMVWLAQWIRENVQDSRVLVITDRIELDKQIVRVFDDAGERMHRAESGADLINKLNSYSYPLLSSLVHKFGQKENAEYDSYIEELQSSLPEDFEPRGDFYVFVDECHRTQSGKLHKAMKSIIPDATYIGFTGTPLLKDDKETSLEVFGPFIHTYKFDEAVEDNVVLDLQYVARDINQQMSDKKSIDEWFESETKGLTDVARKRLMKRWGTLKKLYSSKERLEKIVNDIAKDFKVKPRLSSGLGNAMLVASSIYEACKFYDLFQETDLADHCAIVTSYSPSINDIKGESTGAGSTEEQFKYDIYQEMLDEKSPDQFEEEVKKKFVKQPAKMKLLIVVDKLLTGFDAPSATYLYIDKSMQDHGLFQAICRVNRLDGENKDYGYIIDYKDLFKSLEKSIKDYTSEALEGYEKEDVDGLLKDRYEQAREDLDTALDKVEALCEPVHPQESKYFIRYFCGDPEKDSDLQEKQERREAFYKMSGSLIRAYSNIANEMGKAGYTDSEAEKIKEKVKFFTDVRDEVMQASNDFVDLKTYEPGMRQLIDMYISADASRKISEFGDLTLVDLIVKHGEDALNSLSDSVKKDKEAVAETIENNIRSVVNEERPTNPEYFDKMSDLLKELIKQRKEEAIKYEEYLKRVIELSKKVRQENADDYPAVIDSPAKRALYDNLEQDEEAALALDRQVEYNAKDNWRGDKMKERELKIAVEKALPAFANVDKIMELIKNQKEY